MAINLNELTNGSINRTEPTKPYWQGTAVFDVLMKSVNDNINIQYETNRITGSDYAKVYLAAIETCIKESINFLLQKAAVEKDVDLKQAQIVVANEERRLKAAQADAYPLQASKDAALKQVQVDLYERQIEGFDDNKRQKLFESSVNGWALAYSSGILNKTTIPTFINDASMTQLFTEIKG